MKTIAETFYMTEHCEKRAAQRSLTEPALELVLKYGEVFEQKGRSSLVRYGRRKQKAFLKDLKMLMRIFSQGNDVYLVLGDDGSLVTAGRQTKTIRHND